MSFARKRSYEAEAAQERDLRESRLPEERLVAAQEIKAMKSRSQTRVVDDALQSTAAWWCSGSGVRLVSDTTIAESWADAKG